MIVFCSEQVTTYDKLSATPLEHLTERVDHRYQKQCFCENLCEYHLEVNRLKQLVNVV